LTKPKSAGANSPKGRPPQRTPFQLELIRLIERHGEALGSSSGRSLSARLGKSSNHLWQILNRGMVPSGPAILDIAKLLQLSEGETDGLLLSAIETKGQTRSRDGFWIARALEMVSRRQAEIRGAEGFLEEKGLGRAYEDWKKTRPDGVSPQPKTGLGKA
jgi:hypothetical protein